MGKIIDLTGQQFGKLTVIERVHRIDPTIKHPATFWKCRCECGNEAVVRGGHLVSGHTKSCGCFGSEVRIQNGSISKHGMSGRRPYRIWTQMKTRCYNKSDEHFPDYGGRGITVCDEWKDSFESFCDWAMASGYSDDLTIERIDVNGNYCPENCRWATRKEQTVNRRSTLFLTYKGETKTLKEWSELTGINYQTIRYRKIMGKTPDEILNIQKEKTAWN